MITRIHRSPLERIVAMLEALESQERPQRKTWFAGATRQNNVDCVELLQILVKKGLVEYLDEGNLVSGQRGVYRITDDGRRFLEIWRNLQAMITIKEMLSA